MSRIPTPAEVRGSPAPAANPAPEEFPPSPFACSWSAGDLDSAWIHVVGELDLATKACLQQTLLEAQSHARLLVLDLRELAFIDCSGLRCVLDASECARQAGCRLVILRGRAIVDRVFTLTRACDDVEILDLDPVEEPARMLAKLAGGGATP